MILAEKKLHLLKGYRKGKIVMEYKTNKRLFKLINTAQREGFTLEQIQKLLTEYWDYIKNCNDLFGESIFDKYINEHS